MPRKPNKKYKDTNNIKLRQLLSNIRINRHSRQLLLSSISIRSSINISRYSRQLLSRQHGLPTISSKGYLTVKQSTTLHPVLDFR